MSLLQHFLTSVLGGLIGAGIYCLILWAAWTIVTALQPKEGNQ
jgi:hypothetical protein